MVATCIFCRHPLASHDNDLMDNQGCLYQDPRTGVFCPCKIGDVK